MELAFQTNPLRFLRCSAQEVRYQEETAETIVPDYCPDIARGYCVYRRLLCRFDPTGKGLPGRKRHHFRRHQRRNSIQSGRRLLSKTSGFLHPIYRKI